VSSVFLYRYCVPDTADFKDVIHTRWFKYDRDYLCVNKSQFVPVIFEPPCIILQDSASLHCAFSKSGALSDCY
jgi:hypothetical protein